jgi:oligoendopeptidase F
MGGIPKEAFTLMDEAGLYDISYSENKYDGSFEVYIDNYLEPFVFLSPSQYNYDYLSFAHEFGHFCNDYAAFGCYAGVDVMEVFSQGMEYLSLCYNDDTEDLTKLKMADSLSVYVEQAAFADFEMRMYELTGEDLTVENLCLLYDQVALAYGFDSIGYDDREFVQINHFYESPMYIISYVVSNDAAMQLYQLEQENPGDGLKLYEEHLTTQETFFLAFVESAGLESPFAKGRIEAVRTTFENIFE